MRVVFWALLGCLVAVSADASPVRVGLDAGLFFRGEAGGTHRVLPSFAPRLALELPHGFSATLLWPMAYAPRSEGAGAVSTFHHRVVARGEYALPVGSARFFAGLGAAVVFTHAKLWEGNEAKVGSTTVRAGPAVAVGVDVDVLPWRLRLAAETVFAAGRRDLAVVVGTTLPFGDGR